MTFELPAADEKTAPAGSGTDTAKVPIANFGMTRQVIEAFACLAVAVVLFRTFALEGYIISTGSMAPNLFGYHKRVVCPDCGFQFGYGVAFDREVTTSQIARCPNCSQSQIDISDVPRNDGDQLLVFKNAYAFRDPKRWEVVVFLNPASPNVAYVKRVVGLPNEAIQVVDGDVHINGQVQRKPLDVQRSMRIPVFDHDHPSLEADWVPRWLADTGWGAVDQGFVRGTADSDAYRWLQYSHWGRRIVTPHSVPRPRTTPITDIYGYNRIIGMDDEQSVRDLMLAAQIDLPQTGQFASVLPAGNGVAVTAFDLDAAQLRLWLLKREEDIPHALAARVEPTAVAPLNRNWLGASVEFEFSNFDQQVLIAVNSETLLTQDIPQPSPSKAQRRRQKPAKSRSSQPIVDELVRAPEENVSEGGLPLPGGTIPARAEITIAGRTSKDDIDLAPPLDLTFGDSGASNAKQKSAPIRFGSTGGAFQVRSLRLFRDVHYLSEAGQHATDQPHQLESDEFFFLGDNSPVSLDSRGWKHPAVKRHLLVGRPMMVHLPSKPVRIRLGESVNYIRLPDFERMRWIR